MPKTNILETYAIEEGRSTTYEVTVVILGVGVDNGSVHKHDLKTDDIVNACAVSSSLIGDTTTQKEATSAYQRSGP